MPWSSDLTGKSVQLNQSMELIVSRISNYLPPKQVWEHFSSQPRDTGGFRCFPFYRVDTGLICCSDYLYMIKIYGQSNDENARELYGKASTYAMEVALWVEVGFEGLQNLATHPASRNWTIGVGHSVSHTQRSQAIMTTGKILYNSVMSEFINFWRQKSITGDCINRIGLGPVLEKWYRKEITTRF